MGVGDDRQNKQTALMGPDHLASLTVADRAPASHAKGSDRLARDRIRPAAPTVQVDPEEISGLIELAEVMESQKPADVVSLEADDKKTRKMDADQFRALMKADNHADTTAPLPTSIAQSIIEESRPAIGRAKTVDDPVTTNALSAKMKHPQGIDSSLKQLAAKAAEPAPRKVTTTAELMAQVDDAFADFGPEPELAAVPDATPAPQDDDLAIAMQARTDDTDLAIPAHVDTQSKADDLAIPAQVLVDTESKPVKKPAMIVPDHRLDTRFAAAMSPITKPPYAIPPEPVKPAPAAVIVAPAPVIDAPAPVIAAETRSGSMLVLISVLAVAILVGTLVVLLT